MEAVVQHFYNAGGAIDSTSRWSDPDLAGVDTVTNRWRYDRAGRVVAEIAPDGMQDSTVYDPAGNPIKLITRRGDTISMAYDEVGQLTERIVPEVEYGERNAGLPKSYSEEDDGIMEYPQALTTPYGNYVIRADTAVYQYDLRGNMIAANNGDARISRTYYPTGALRRETQIIRKYDDADFLDRSTHRYELRYEYDLNGRRTDLVHPAQLRAGTPSDRTVYTYDETTGALKTVTDLMGNSFTYGYDDGGRVISLEMPSGVSESYEYNRGEQLRLHKVSNNTSPATSLRFTEFDYDRRGRITAARDSGQIIEYNEYAYSGLGHLISQASERAEINNPGSFYLLTESFSYDALGYLYFGSTENLGVIGTPGHDTSNWQGSYSHEPNVGRVTERGNLTSNRDYFFYDHGGNTVFVRRGGSNAEDRASYYAADGKLRAADYRTLRALGGEEQQYHYRRSFEEYRYDALGRRILVHTDNSCIMDGGSGHFAADCRVSMIRRTVWDGVQELYEIQMPIDAQHRDNDTADLPELPHIPIDENVNLDLNAYYGRVAYTHGAGLDKPLSVIRMGYADALDVWWNPATLRRLDPFAIIPLWNYRGRASLGYFAKTGETTSCETDSQQRLRCVDIFWLDYAHAYRLPNTEQASWQGSLLADKRDATGTHYRRNRHYDPATGRFTQEDPIGLAGGLNLYGYANGDPVNFSDPFGLCPQCGEGDDGVRPREGLGNRLAHGLFEPCSADNNTDCMPTPLTGVVPGAVGGPAGGVSVYQAVSSGAVRYVGITKNFAARAAAHFRQRGLAIRAIDGLEDLSRVDARAVEQVLIEAHGLAKNGGTLLNRINSIAESNPAYANALRRGLELLQNVGYPIP